MGRLEASAALDLDLPRHGMVGIVRHSSFLAPYPASGAALDFKWGRGLHFRSPLLCGKTAALQPLRLASICHRGNSLPFLRCPLVCGVAEVPVSVPVNEKACAPIRLGTSPL